jgi:hypothetical protein
MKKFKFTAKGSNEAISSTQAENIEDAIEFFAEKKKLSTEAFLKIYEVDEA